MVFVNTGGQGPSPATAGEQFYGGIQNISGLFIYLQYTVRCFAYLYPRINSNPLETMLVRVAEYFTVFSNRNWNFGMF